MSQRYGMVSVLFVLLLIPVSTSAILFSADYFTSKVLVLSQGMDQGDGP